MLSFLNLSVSRKRKKKERPSTLRHERFDLSSPGDRSVISNVENVSIAALSVTQQTVNQPVVQPLIDDPQKVISWLSPINYRIIQNDTFSKHTSDTGAWFINHPKFQEWCSGSTPLLCAKGPPGVGKTILSSIVIRHLETSFPDKQFAVIYAYCRYTEPRSMSDILASFSKQLAERHSHLHSAVESFYRNHLADSTRPIEQDWLELLQTLIPLFSRVYVVVDALDEFPDNARDNFLKVLISLQARLLVTSRPSIAFLLLGDVDYVEIEIGDENEQDIELFIRQRFQDSSKIMSLLRKRKQLGREMIAKLKELSKSMFLVAALQIDSLEDCITATQLRQAADSLPSDIDDMYSASWARVKAQSKKRILLAEETIIWLTHAYRPLRITELQHALALQCDGTFHDESVADEEVIVSACCGLIAIDKESRIVRLVHFTALDFFKRLGRDLCPTPHTFISSRCLSYLSAHRCSMSKISTREELEDFLSTEQHPLRDYAYRQWGSHASRCYDEAGLPKSVSEFLNQCVRYPCMMEIGDFDLFKPCHVAVYYGLWDRLEHLTGWYNQPTLLTKATPLILACSQGHVDITKSILSRIDIAINTEDANGWTALMSASANGHDTVVKLLLSRNDITIQGGNGATALISASQNGHEAVVKLLLLQTDIAVNTQAGDGYTALILASRNGHEAVVKLLLLQTDIAVNTQAGNGYTALISASQKGHEVVVKLLLLQTDIAINTQAGNGATALILASRNGHEAVVKLLLSQADIAVNTQAGNGATALILASHNGHEAVVKLLLLQTDIAVNTQTGNGYTALILASRNGHEAVVKLLLLQTDIAVNTQAGDGATALILASQNGHEAVVKLLLSQTDIAINTQAGNGDTALILASENGYEAVVRLLLSQADIVINTQGRDGVTAFILASQNGYEAVAKLLLHFSLLIPSP